MVAALEENERSATFGWDLSSAADATGLDDPASCSIAPMHSLSPHHPDAFVGGERHDGGADGGGFPWADLRPTGVSWNASVSTCAHREPPGMRAGTCTDEDSYAKHVG